MNSSRNPAVVFDDLRQDESPFYGIVSGEDAAQAILRRAHHRRRRQRSNVITGIGDTTTATFDAGGRTYTVLGDDEPSTDGLPVYGSLVKQFSDSLPESKLARVDNAQSYAEFRAARREPYLQNLGQRLATLEAAFAAHEADHHGGGRVDALDAALRKHIDECVCGGDAINLPGAAAASGRIQAWQDGPEILVTICVPCTDGQARLVTSGAPVMSVANEVVGCAMIEGVDADTLLEVAPPLMRVIGAARLVDQLIGAVEEVIDCAGAPGTVVALHPATDPHVAAAMALLQRCQMGDWSACRDARKLQSMHENFLSNAADRLLTAQRVS